MKYFIILLIIISTSLKSQSSIIDIEEPGFGKPNGYYQKDTNNILDPFQGTYIYANGNTSFKIILTKMMMQPVASHYEDLIIGEYQYIENGVEKINTLSNLNIPYSDQYLKHAIAGNDVLWNNSREWKCPLCNPNEKRLAVVLEDKISGRSADFLMRRTVINGQQVMQVMVQHISSDPIVVGSNAPAQPEFTLPTDEFIMVKQ